MSIPNHVLVPVGHAIEDLASSRTLEGAVKALLMGAKGIDTHADLMPTDLSGAKRVLALQGAAVGAGACAVVLGGVFIAGHVYLRKTGRLISREEAAALPTGAPSQYEPENFDSLEQAVVRVEERLEALHRRTNDRPGDE